MKTKSDIISYVTARYLYELKIIDILVSKEQTNSTTPRPELSFFSLANKDQLTELLESLQKVHEKAQEMELNYDTENTVENTEVQTSETTIATPSVQEVKKSLELIRKNPELAKRFGKELLDFLESRSEQQHEAILKVVSNNNLSYEQLQSELLLASTKGEENLTVEKLQDTCNHIQNSNFLNFYKDLIPQPKLENTESNLENNQQFNINKLPDSSINEEINNTIKEIQSDNMSQAQNTMTQTSIQSQHIFSETNTTTITPRPTAAPAA